MFGAGEKYRSRSRSGEEKRYVLPADEWALYTQRVECYPFKGSA